LKLASSKLVHCEEKRRKKERRRKIETTEVKCNDRPVTMGGHKKPELSSYSI